MTRVERNAESVTRGGAAGRVGGAGLLALVATYGIGRQAYGLFVPSLRDEFDLPLDVLGLYASAAQAGYLAATVVTGFLTARFGPRMPVVTGCLVLSVAAALTASAPGPVLLAVGVILAGTSAGGAWAPFSDAVRLQVPRSWAPRSLALVNAGAPVGLVVASGLVLVAGDRWRAAWWVFAAIGLLAALVAWRVLVAGPSVGSTVERGWPGFGWFLNARSLPLFVVAAGASSTSGAYLVHAPARAQDAGLAPWIGPAMWAGLGLAGAAAGVFGGEVARRWGLRRPLAVALGLLCGSILLLLVTPGAVAAVLCSAALFGVGFTVGFALMAMWSQRVFHDAPSTGFTSVIVAAAVGFIVGPGLFGVLVTRLGPGVALASAAVPALVAAAVPPAREDRGRLEGSP